MNISHPQHRNNGFTLIELSIVLVIIGLVIGGIFVGRDLIQASKIQQVISQSQTISNAVRAFKNKYNELPGDMTQTRNFFAGACSGSATVYGNGNGLISGWSAGATTGGNGLDEGSAASCHLMAAGLLTGTCEPTWDPLVSSCGRVGPAFTSPYAQDAEFYFPGFTHSAPDSTNNYTVIHGTTSTGSTYDQRTGVVRPLDGYGMDIKIDDGMPNTGKVRGMQSLVNGTASVPNNCTIWTNRNGVWDTYYYLTTDTTLCRIGFML